MKKLFIKYKEVISYLFFGVCTTLINIISFYFFSKTITHEVSNVLAWVVSVAFAYITNKLFVFNSKGFNIKEIISFVSARVASLLIDEGLLILMVNILGINMMISKTIISFLVIVINYVLSKFLVFAKGGNKNGK